MDPGVDARVSALAARIAEGWGRDFHHAPLTAAIGDLYQDLIGFPAAWPQDRCHRFSFDAADTAAR